ncbi:MAG: FeoB-associated Cys-rich membrane protein [Eubacteriaceae bacterium]|jgi:hypothetical protein
MIATILISLIIAALFVLAVRHIVKHGSCSECSKNSDACSGHCGCCPYHADEMKFEEALKNADKGRKTGQMKE